jgi:hypothetical protein
MSQHPGPNFDDLVGPEVSGAERERLRRAHELLVQAGPPPELSPELERVPWPDDALQPLGLIRRPSARRRPWVVYATAVAAILVVGFLLGQSFGSRSSSLSAARIVRMHGTAAAPGALASIAVGNRGADGNWPMLVTVSNLPPVVGGYYDLWLSRHGNPVAMCGSFNTRAGVDTVVRMSAAYQFERGRFDGWIVTRHVPGQPEGKWTTVMTT